MHKYLAVKVDCNDRIQWQYAGPFDTHKQAEQFCDKYNGNSMYPLWIVQQFTHEGV